MSEVTTPIGVDSSLPEAVNRMLMAGERVRITRDGTEIAGLIPIEDLEFLEDIEDRLDLLEVLEAVQEAAEEGGVIPWEVFEKELKP